MIENGNRRAQAVFKAYAADKTLNSDKKITLDVIAKDPSAIRYASEELKNDFDVALAAVKGDGRTLAFLSEQMRSEPEIVEAATANFARGYLYALGRGKESEKAALAVAASGGETIAALPEKFLDDEKICLAAITKNPKAAGYFSERLRSDKDIALKVILSDRTAANLLADGAFSHREVANAVFKPTNGTIAPNALNNDSPAGMFYALEDYGLKVNIAAQRLDLKKLDKEKLKILLSRSVGDVAEKTELMKKYVLEDDCETLSAIISACGISSLVVDKLIPLASKNGKLRVLSLLLSKKTFAAAKREFDERSGLIRSLKRGSAKGVEKFIQKKDEYKDDEEMVYLAVKADGKVLTELKDSKFYGDETLTDICLANYVVRFADQPLLKELSVPLNENQAIKACAKDGRNFRFLPENFKENKAVAIEAVKSDKTVYETLSQELKSDADIIWYHKI